VCFVVEGVVSVCVAVADCVLCAGCSSCRCVFVLGGMADSCVLCIVFMN